MRSAGDIVHFLAVETGFQSYLYRSGFGGGLYELNSSFRTDLSTDQTPYAFIIDFYFLFEVQCGTSYFTDAVHTKGAFL